MARDGGTAKLAKDTSGTFVKNLGWKEEEGTKQHRFYLGKDEKEAAARAARLEQVWAAVEQRWRRGPQDTARPVWDEVALQIGKAVSNGKLVCDLEVPEWIPDPMAVVDGLQPLLMATEGIEPGELAYWLRDLQADFRFIRLVLGEGSLQDDVDEAARQEADALVSRSRKLLARNTHQTLHEALDAFGVHLRARYSDSEGRLSPTGQVAVKEIPTLKAHAKDVPLGDFDLAAIEAVIDHWAKRPLIKHGRPAAVKTCKNAIKRIRMFVRWLHREKAFDWRKPEDYEVLPVKVTVSPAELSRKLTTEQVQTYSDDELATLWKHARPKERLFMLLALNTGAGIAEIATLQLGDIHIGQAHAKYKGVSDYVMRLRYKTHVPGFWPLWPTTVAGIRWYQSVRPQTEETAFVLTDAGQPVLEQTSGGNRAQTIPNSWHRVTGRVRKLEQKPDFKKLSFNKLRKTAINAVREIAGGEVAGVFACHGQPVQTDNLIDLYSNRDYSKVVDACRQWGERLAPMFASVPEPFKAAKRKHRKPSAYMAQRAEVLKLRGQGKTYRQIGELTGISFRAVRHHVTKGGEQKAKE